MIEFWSFMVAFVFSPALVAALAYLAVRLHERSLEKDHPAE